MQKGHFLSSMANHVFSGLLPHQEFYPLVPKVQPEEENFGVSSAGSVGACQNLKDDLLPVYSSQLVSSDPYNFLTGGDQLQEVSSNSSRVANVGAEQGSSFLGTLYSQPSLTLGGFHSKLTSVYESKYSWPGGDTALAGQYNNPPQNAMITNGSALLASPASTPTAQLLDGGRVQSERSFSGGIQLHKDPTFYYPSSRRPESMQLYYINPGGFAAGYSSDPSTVTTLFAPGSDAEISSSQQGSSTDHIQQQYNGLFPDSALVQNAESQRTAAIASAGIPLIQQGTCSNGLQGSRAGNHGPYNQQPRDPGELFLSNEASQNCQSPFDNLEDSVSAESTEVRRTAPHDLAESPRPKFPGEAVVHGRNLERSHESISSGNGQGLSLSLSSHQRQSSLITLQLRSQQESGVSETDITVAAYPQHSAAEASSKDATRESCLTVAKSSMFYIQSSAGDGAGALKFHVPADVGRSNSSHINSTFMSGPAMSAGSSNRLSFLKLMIAGQEILCELSGMTRPGRRSARPAKSEQRMPVSGSSVGIDRNATQHRSTEDAKSEVITDTVEISRDGSNISEGLLDVNSQESELSQSLAGTARKHYREIIQLKIQLGGIYDQVERSHRRYCDRLQMVIRAFNSEAGPDAAIPYTGLARQAMSRHFRCLRDAVGGQRRVVRRALGEDDAYKTGRAAVTSRIQYVDQQPVHQQCSLEQFGLYHHAWRPQRGLPERAVSVLRAWLFEHFLYPYPKDADKVLLAKQTGLTRSQVSNWFINARVRLWKPMIEEMYLEDHKEVEQSTGSGGSTRDKVENRERYEQFYDQGRERGTAILQL